MDGLKNRNIAQRILFVTPYLSFLVDKKTKTNFVTQGKIRVELMVVIDEQASGIVIVLSYCLFRVHSKSVSKCSGHVNCFPPCIIPGHTALK